MQFQVPQFIDVAPKIVGPLTIKQFLFLAAAAVPLVILIIYLQFWLWLIIALFLGSVSIALAFLKVNGQPFPKILLAGLNYLWQPRFYLWRTIKEPLQLPALPKMPKEAPVQSLIKDLLLKLTTTRQPIEKREKPFRLFTLPKISKITLAKPPSFETVRKLSGERKAAKRVDYR